MRKKLVKLKFKLLLTITKAMGDKISIDKHLSSVDDLLETNPHYFKSKIKFDNKIPESITHHVKVSHLHALNK